MKTAKTTVLTILMLVLLFQCGRQYEYVVLPGGYKRPINTNFALAKEIFNPQGIDNLVDTSAVYIQYYGQEYWQWYRFFSDGRICFSYLLENNIAKSNRLFNNLNAVRIGYYQINPTDKIVVELFAPIHGSNYYVIRGTANRDYVKLFQGEDYHFLPEHLVSRLIRHKPDSLVLTGKADW